MVVFWFVVCLFFLSLLSSSGSKLAVIELSGADVGPPSRGVWEERNGWEYQTATVIQA